ncbi:MAG TPA: SRPBCC family protein [Thermoanaerobaculia bacterium]
METEIQIRQSFVVNLSRKETYAFWRRVEEFPRFMRHLESVEPIDAKRSRWVIGGPPGRTMTWETEIVEENPGSTVAWRTVGRSDVRHDGRVELYDATAGRGTVVCLRLTYQSPAHKGRSALTRVFRDDPETQIRGDLRRFRRLVENGEPPRERRPAESEKVG